MINWVRPTNINFGMICFLVVAAPLARGSVHLWATTLIQMCALTGVFLIVVGYLFSNPDARLETLSPIQPPHKKSRPQFPDKYILSAMALVAIISALFSKHPSLSAEGLSMLFTYMAIYWMTKTSVNTRKKQRILVYVIIANAVFMSILGLLILNNINPFTPMGLRVHQLQLLDRPLT